MHYHRHCKFITDKNIKIQSPIERLAPIAYLANNYCLEQNENHEQNIEIRLEQHSLERNTIPLESALKFWLKDNRFRKLLGCKEVSSTCK